MLQVISKVVLLGLLFLGAESTAQAFQAEELREKARAMQKEAAALAERGRGDAAERLNREATQLIEEAERQEVRATDSSPAN